MSNQPDIVVKANLPVLDISGFRADETSAAAEAFVQDLRQVAHHVGFFYLSGHGVPAPLALRIQQVAREFFALPEEQRLEISNIHSPQFRGYTPVGQELTNGRQDVRDQVDIARELPAPALRAGDPSYLRLRGPNLWPQVLPDFRTVATQWFSELERVGTLLLHAVSRVLGQASHALDYATMPYSESLLKIIRYPARSERFDTDQGVGSHRDGGLLTFVHQDAVGGLQVERDGAFVDAPQVPGTFVINFGEMLELVSRGFIRATQHRVVSPLPGQDRVSVCFFFGPNLESTLRPLTLPPELAAQTPEGALVRQDDPVLARYGENSLKFRLRSHPDVARRYHADLLDASATRSKAASLSTAGAS